MDFIYFLFAMCVAHTSSRAAKAKAAENDTKRSRGRAQRQKIYGARLVYSWYDVKGILWMQWHSLFYIHVAYTH